MNKPLGSRDVFNSSGLSPNDISRLLLSQDVVGEAHSLMAQILNAESVAATFLAEASARRAVTDWRHAEMITWNQVMDLNTLYKAASSERVDQLARLL
jgi:hypothetical protein